MSPRSPQILERLLGAMTSAEVEAIIADTPPLSDPNNWKPVGGLKNNEGPIRHGADAGDALMERVTNAIDAVLERERMEKHADEPMPKSPREAAEEWFGIPDGRLAFLMPPQKRRKLAERIKVVLEESGLERAPTVTVRDTGVGQHATDFERTLLSINADNKVDRPYLMGAYGQGGASTYAFTLRREAGSPGYSIVVSRRPPELLEGEQSDVVGWTIVRYNPLDEDYKNGRFEYCTEPDGSIPSVPAADLSEEFEPGTLLKFIQYDLQGYSTVISAPRSSMWYLSNTVLFDPVLPFLIADRRKSYKTVKESKSGQLDKVILGNANKLEIAEEDEEDVVDHTLSHTVNLGENGKLKVRYWVFKRRPARESGHADLAIDAYSDTHSAVVFTLNGQRQGRESRTYLKNNLGMGILRNYLLVQVDCDELAKIAKKNIFSSTRDRMKQTSLYREILDEVGEILKADEDLKRIAHQLHQASATAIAEEDRKKIEKEFGRLVEQWEAREVTDVEIERLEEKKDDRKPEEPEEPEDEEPPAPPPSPIELFDVPTMFEFATEREPLRIPLGKRYNVRLHLNAVNDYLTRESKRGELSVLLSEGAPVSVRSTSALKMGRMGVALLPKKAAKEGDEFTIGLSVTRPGEQALTISRKAILVKPREKKKHQERRPVIPEIVAVTEGNEQWLNLNWTTADVAEVNTPAGGRPKIYVSLSNEDYSKNLGRKGISEEQIATYQRKYMTAVAFHAWLQHRDASSATQEIEEAARKAELRRTVRTVIYTTFRGGEDGL